MFALAVSASHASAQAPGFSRSAWKQVETEHFLFLYPEPLSEWALDMARRMESVHEAVSAMVGFEPEERVTVLVDDPGNVSNGSMNPGPLLYMWPTPPNPRSLIGENRGWGEILAVHEFAHAAHLARPSRNPVDRFLWNLVPIPITRWMWTAPRWVTEGYATYIEGRLTGSGRPHGVWRPAVLRTWALEGQLPTYGQLSGSSGYYGGAMAYLVGSAYLEWLVEREGGDEEVLPNLWRRVTARQKRSFGGAFTGVFGAPPSELYGLFTVDVTERALEVRDAVEAAGGVVDGELFQRLSWSTGDPAVSPDGQHLALVLRQEDGPSRLVVINTTPDTLPTKVVEARERIFEEDPEDVRPVERLPRSQRPEAVLWPTGGRPYDAPAWMPDGSGILVVRSDPAANDLDRPDLFLWEWEEDELRRITTGAAIREASPSPDGSWAVGTRCLHARCDIVRIDLNTGLVLPLTSTDPLQPFYHPRVSPDGETIVASRQTEAGWRLVALDADGSDLRAIGPQHGAARFDAEFVPGTRTLVLTSTLGGIHDLELLDLDSGEVAPLTRVVSAAVAPAPGPEGEVFFLSLHSRGWDLRRIAAETAPVLPVVVAPAALTPAAPVPPEAVDTFPVAEIGPVRPYGLGPRFRSVVPMVSTSVDGSAGGAVINATDPIGRLSWQLQGMIGSDDAPDGASLRALWRGGRPWIHGEVFGVRETVSQATFWGGAASGELRHGALGRRGSLRVGGSAGELADDARLVGFADYTLRTEQLPRTWRLGQELHVNGAIGRSGDLEWTRWLVSGGVSVGGESRGLAVSGLIGGTDAPAASVEAFAIGGTEPLLFDPAILSQRVGMPALRAGALRGDAVRTFRADAFGFLPASVFYWTGSVDADAAGWHSMIGAELEGGGEAVPYLRLPSARVRMGVAHLLSGPGEGDWRGWAVLSYQP